MQEALQQVCEKHCAEGFT